MRDGDNMDEERKAKRFYGLKIIALNFNGEKDKKLILGDLFEF